MHLFFSLLPEKPTRTNSCGPALHCKQPEPGTFEASILTILPPPSFHEWLLCLGAFFSSTAYQGSLNQPVVQRTFCISNLSYTQNYVLTVKKSAVGFFEAHFLLFVCSCVAYTVRRDHNCYELTTWPDGPPSNPGQRIKGSLCTYSYCRLFSLSTCVCLNKICVCSLAFVLKTSFKERHCPAVSDAFHQARTSMARNGLNTACGGAVFWCESLLSHCTEPFM